MIRILHAADIHLDSPFAKLDLKRSEVRKNELRGAFSSLLTYARLNDVHLILLSGDLFDSEYVTKETAALMVREFERIPNIRIVIAPGNHDPYTENGVYAKIRFPENVYVFDKETVDCFSFEIEGQAVDVYGYAFTSESMKATPLAGNTVRRKGNLNLLCAHCDLTSPISPYCPTSPRDLDTFGADYAALGHVHNAEDIQTLPGGGYYAYSGCLEGRAFDETGPKGAVVIDAEKTGERAELQIKRVRFSKRRYETKIIPVDGATTLTDILSRITAALTADSLGEDTLLRAVLRGAVDPELVIRPEAIAASLEERLFFCSVRDETSPTYGADYLERDLSVRGEFYRLLLPALRDGTPDERRIAAKALRYGLAALAGGDVIDFE